jgi:hypothetical protein
MTLQIFSDPIAYHLHASAEFTNGMDVDFIAPAHFALCLQDNFFRRDVVWFTQDRLNDYARIDGDTSLYSPVIYFAQHIEKNYAGQSICMKYNGMSHVIDKDESFKIYHEDNKRLLLARDYDDATVFDPKLATHTSGFIPHKSYDAFVEQQYDILRQSERNLKEYLDYQPYGYELKKTIALYNAQEGDYQHEERRLMKHYHLCYRPLMN